MNDSQITITEGMERIKRAPPNKGVRDITGMPVGETNRQGDVYLTRLEPRDASGLKPYKADNAPGSLARRQVAGGMSRGSRHCFREEDIAAGRVQLFVTPLLPTDVPGCDLIIPPNIEDAPYVVVHEDGVMLEHPDHPHCMYGRGHFQVSYQTDARTGRRVQD